MKGVDDVMAEFELIVNVIGGSPVDLPDDITEQIINSIRQGNTYGLVALSETH